MTGIMNPEIVDGQLPKNNQPTKDQGENVAVRLWGGVRLLGSGPSIRNIQKLDAGARPFIIECIKTGMMIDPAHFIKMEVELTRDMERITEEVKQMTGRYVNLASGDQVSDLLFKKLGLHQARFKLTKSGDRESVEDEVLTAIQHDHPVVPKILEYKEFDKLRGTYVRPIPKLSCKDGNNVWRLYPNLSDTRVPSGRLSCKSPNLLAMPTRTDRGRQIREGFICPDGWRYCSVDESQIEVRLAAHSSGDPNLIRVYENEEDIYSDFAITAFGLKDARYKDNKGEWQYPGVDKDDHRRPSKTCILAWIYDVTAKGLLEQMPTIYINGKPKWTEEGCQRLITSASLKYQGVIEDRKRFHRIARRLGYVYDMWGRLLHCAGVRSILPWVVNGVLREVGNFPYQSGAQGTIKLAMAETHDMWEQGGLSEVIKPQLQIHDELLYICRNDVIEEWMEYVKGVFEHCAPLRVPIKAGGASAVNWGSLEK
jgi:DNA polymerase-1